MVKIQPACCLNRLLALRRLRRRGFQLIRSTELPTREINMQVAEHSTDTSTFNAEEASSSDELVNSANEADPEMDSEDDLKRANTFLRIGKANGILRLARSPSSFLRIGRRPPLHFVRIGKAPSSMFLRIGKRVDDSENDDLNEYDADKMSGRDTRASPSSFLRIGKSGNEVEDEIDDTDETVKRVNAFLRIGRQNDPSSFLRIGKSLNNDDLSKDKRTNAFLRIGKIPASSFIRLGRGPFTEDNGINTRGFRGPTRGFLRIGKRAAIPDGSHADYFSDLNVKSQ
uniref:FMRFamide neuropeptide n=1 Tax=Octopus bimaculoides TaxID=37653 RepID=A0A0L8IGE2_OCTBM